MKALIKYIFGLLFFWFLVFFVNRIFFVLYQWPIGAKIKQDADLWKAFVMGYKLDISTGTILLGLPLIVAIAFYIFQKSYLPRVIFGLCLTLLLLYTAVALSDTGLYKEWNAKINMQALAHFKNPAEVFRTLSLKLIVLFLVLLTAFTAPFYWLYKKKIHTLLILKEEMSFRSRLWKGVLFFMISVTLGVFAIRGGVTNIPINQSVAYFSNDALANDIAVNPFYNLLQDMTVKNVLPDEALYKFHTNEEARALIQDDFPSAKDSSLQVFKIQRPNLVYIFLESWSVDNVSILGGVQGCTPQFDKLCSEGLLFPKAYATAYVSDQGIPAVLSAYPGAMRLAIINQPAKVPGLPCISEQLKPLGYQLGFMFGGDLVYGNLRGYLLEKQFDQLTEEVNFTQYPKGSLGVHDEYTFPEFLKTLNASKSPFLQCFFTTSTHMPYDYKPTDDWKSEPGDPEKKYTESVHYSDIHLGRFFEAAKKQTWYDSTIFIVIADHSHNTIRQRDPASSMHSHIPLLITGGALKEEWRGKQWDKIVSQLDITSTVLHQMKLPADRFPWSRDIFNPATPSSAYYIFWGGAGYINDQGYASAHQIMPHHLISDMKDSVLIKHHNTKAQSFQQLVYEDVKGRK
ncbi:MAG: sulfatase-like hydrolase/transferase [Chitinophagaceae bacterium]|nr:sulfatase-like hydrolase/transferase [Chitinophagaceae bacterium]